MQKGFVIGWVLVLVMILITLGGGYYYWQLKQNENASYKAAMNADAQMVVYPHTPQPSPIDYSSLSTTSSAQFDNWKVYKDEWISFKYPVMDTNCCVLGGPMGGKVLESKTFAVASTVAQGTDAPFDGFSFSIVQLEGINFEVYLAEEQRALLLSYKEHKGSELQDPENLQVIVDGQTGDILKNFAWFGPSHDLLYIPFPDKTKVLEIDMLERKKGSFQPTFNKILSTFKFTQ